MRINKTEIRLRRLLAAVPQQTNKLKLVHHLSTLKNLLNTLKSERGESSSLQSSDGKTEFYSRSIEEVARKLGVNKTEDVWESLSLETGVQVRGQVSFSDDVHELSLRPSTSYLPLFPSCLKRKYSPDAESLSGPELTASGVEDWKKLKNDTLGKRICLELEKHEAVTSEELMNFDHEPEQLGIIEQEYGREDVTEGTYKLKHLEEEVEDIGKVNFEDNREGEIEHLDHNSHLYITQHQTDQEKMVDEMLLLTRCIKENSRRLGHILHDTMELLSSSEPTIRYCLSATTSAHLKSGELLTRTQERECGCATWLSLLLMYFAFLSMVIYIRVT